MRLSDKHMHDFMRARAMLVAGLLAAACAGCRDTPQTPVAGEDLLGLRSDMVAYDTDTYLTNAEGIRAAKIHADTAFYFDDSTVVHMQGVAMELYTDAGGVRATVTALAGRYDPQTQGMHAQGDVDLVMPTEGRQVESGELWYEPVEEKIWSDSAAVYTVRGQVTRGTCFRSDLSFKNYSVCNIRGAADVAP
jgi:LPS export ABC transporter protein LptC